MHQLSPSAIVDAWHAIWDRGDVSAFDDIVVPGYMRLSTNSQSKTTLGELKAEVLAIKAGFPDLRTVVDAVVVEGDTVAIFWSSEGTHSEPFLGVPPTRRRVRTSGSNLARLADGKIVSETVTWDGSQLLANLGVKSLRDALPAVDTSDVIVDDLSGDPGPDMLKGFNRQFVTGITVVTTMDADHPRGLAVNSYASISLEPPLVMVCVQKTSSTYDALFASSHLGINIIGTRQRETLATFASTSKDKFAEIDWHSGPHGSPLIDGSAAAIEAEIRERYQAKTHTLFVCRVRHAEITADDPLIYRAGRFYDSSGLTAL